MSGVAEFVQPNSAPGGHDAAGYKAAIDAAIKVLSQQAAAFAPHAASTPNMTVKVDAGSFQTGITRVSQAQQTTAVLTAPTTNPRNDLLVIDQTSGALSVVAGTPASSPADPAIPSSKIAVGRVRMRVGMNATTDPITNADIDDLRPLYLIPASGSRSGAAYLTLNSGTPNVTLTAASAQVQNISPDVSGRSITMPAMNTLPAGASAFVLKNPSENSVQVLDSGGTCRDVIPKGAFYSVDVLDNSGVNTQFNCGYDGSGGAIDAARTALTLAVSNFNSVAEVVRFSDEKFLVVYLKNNGANLDFCARIIQVTGSSNAVTLGAECVFGSNLAADHAYGSACGGVSSAMIVLHQTTAYAPGSTYTVKAFGLTISGTTLTATSAYTVGSASGYATGGAINLFHVGSDNWICTYGYHYVIGSHYCASYAKLLYLSGGAVTANGSTYGVTAGENDGGSFYMIMLTKTAIACSMVAGSVASYIILDVTPGVTPTWTSTARTGTYATTRMPGEIIDNRWNAGYYDSEINALGMTMTPTGSLYSVTGAGATRATALATRKAKPFGISQYESSTQSLTNLATFLKDGSTYRTLRLDGAGGYLLTEQDDTTANLNINYCANPCVKSSYQTAGQIANKPLIQRAFSVLSNKAAVFFNTVSDQLVVDVHALTKPFKL